MAQLIPVPLTVSCSSKSQIGFTFLVPAHPGIVPDKGPLNGCVCGMECYPYLLYHIPDGIGNQLLTAFLFLHLPCSLLQLPTVV